MNDNIVAIYGGAALPPGEPDEEVVRILRGALAEAMRGEYVAVAVAYITPGREIGWDLSSHNTIGLISALAQAQHDALHRQTNRDVPRPALEDEPA
jgi:hypothetical protein